jgi:hypothetical protein
MRPTGALDHAVEHVRGDRQLVHGTLQAKGTGVWLRTPVGRKGVTGRLVSVTPITETSIFPKVNPAVSDRSAFSPY